MPTEPEILPASRRAAVPWKNGGGVTREIAAAPSGASLDDFLWRVSTAEVRSAGPFSLFAGVDRTLCVLEGELSLVLAGRAVRLSRRAPPFPFAGDEPVRGEPVGAPVTDLNVMTRRGRCAAGVRYLDLAAGEPLRLQAATTLLFALVPLTLEAHGRAFPLARWDAARFTGEAACTVAAGEGPAALCAIEIDGWPHAAGSEP